MCWCSEVHAEYDAALDAAEAARQAAMTAAGQDLAIGQASASGDREVADAQAREIYMNAGAAANTTWVADQTAAEQAFVGAQSAAVELFSNSSAAFGTAFGILSNSAFTSSVSTFADGTDTPWADLLRETAQHAAQRNDDVAAAQEAAAGTVAAADRSQSEAVAALEMDATHSLAAAREDSNNALAAAGMTAAQNQRDVRNALAAQGGATPAVVSNLLPPQQDHRRPQTIQVQPLRHTVLAQVAAEPPSTAFALNTDDQLSRYERKMHNNANVRAAREVRRLQAIIEARDAEQLAEFVSDYQQGRRRNDPAVGIFHTKLNKLQRTVLADSYCTRTVGPHAHLSREPIY